MVTTITGTIIPGLLCAIELASIWRASHSVRDVLADAPAVDGAATLLTLI